MGTMKNIPGVVPTVDQDQLYPLIPFSERVYLPDSLVRRSLENYCLQGLKKNIFDEMIASLNNEELSNFVKFTSSISQDCVTVSNDYKTVRKVIRLFCHTEPITGLFQFSILDKEERKTIALLSHGKSTRDDTLIPIFQKMETLECLVNCIRPTKDNAGLITLHPVVSPLLRSILTKIELLFKHPSRKLVEFYSKSDEYYNYFPAFATNYK